MTKREVNRLARKYDVTDEKLGSEATQDDVALFVEAVDILVELQGMDIAAAKDTVWNDGEWFPVAESLTLTLKIPEESK